MFLGSGVWGMRGMDGDEVGSEEVGWDGMNDGIGRWCGVFSKRKEKMDRREGDLLVRVRTDRSTDRSTDRIWSKAEWVGKNRWWFRFMNERFRSTANGVPGLVYALSAREGVRFSLSGKQAKA